MYMNLGCVCLVTSTLAIGSASATGDGEANLKTTIHAGAETEAEPSDSAGGLDALVAPIRDSLTR
jgi:hypothetical protein